MKAYTKKDAAYYAWDMCNQYIEYAAIAKSEYEKTNNQTYWQWRRRYEEIAKSYLDMYNKLTGNELEFTLDCPEHH